MNHIEQVKAQLGRSPLPFPTVKIVGGPQSIEDFTADSIVVENYHSWPAIATTMAV
jgi:thymidylate synthase